MSSNAQGADVSRPAIWFGLLGGAIAWTAHLMLAYGIAEFGCVSQFGDRHYWGISAVAWWELVLTVVTTLFAAAATMVAYYNDRRLRSAAEDEQAAASGEQYAVRAGLLTSGLFTFIILFESIPILYYLQSC